MRSIVIISITFLLFSFVHSDIYWVDDNGQRKRMINRLITKNIFLFDVLRERFIQDYN